MMKFFMTPGSCSTGIHILLEELDLVFQVELVDLLKGDNLKDEYVALNPKANIPLLITEHGQAITEFQAIAYWLARSNPRAKLIPENLDDEVRMFEIMDYVVATLHMQGFARIFTTDKFTPNKADYEKVKERGKEIIGKGFTVMEKLISGDPWVVNTFSIADAALFYVEFWADRTDIPMPPKCKKHFDSMLQRLKVRQVLQEEGYRV